MSAEGESNDGKDGHHQVRTVKISEITLCESFPDGTPLNKNGPRPEMVFEAVVPSQQELIDYHFQFKLVLKEERIAHLCSNDMELVNDTMKTVAYEMAGPTMLKIAPVPFACISCKAPATGFVFVMQRIPTHQLPLLHSACTQPVCDKEECNAKGLRGLHSSMQKLQSKDVLGNNPKRSFLATCSNCNKLEDEIGKMKCCSRCHSVFYCNRACQKKHWKTHKKVCKEQEKLSKGGEYITHDDIGPLQTLHTFS